MLQALKLSGRELQGGGAFPIADAACQGRGDQTGAGHFLPAHRESLHRETTFSRSSDQRSTLPLTAPESGHTLAGALVHSHHSKPRDRSQGGILCQRKIIGSWYGGSLTR